jgi:hypothetical protein
LAHGLYEWGGFDVADSAAELQRKNQCEGVEVKLSTNFNDTDVRLLRSIVDRDLGYTLNPILDGVCKVRNNLEQGDRE